MQHGTPAAQRLYRLAMHLTLVVGSIIFSMPFIWMISSSLKEDDEQITDELVWIPRLPPFQPQSPYMDSREGVELARPRDIKLNRWESYSPGIISALDTALKAGPKTPAGNTSEELAFKLLRARLWHDISKSIPSENFMDENGLRVQIAKLWNDAARTLSAQAFSDPVLLKAAVEGMGRAVAAQLPADVFKDESAVKAELQKGWSDESKRFTPEMFKDEVALKKQIVAIGTELAVNIRAERFAGVAQRGTALARLIAAKCTAEQIQKSHRMIYRALTIGDVSLRAEGKSIEVVHPWARARARPGAADLDSKESGAELLWKNCSEQTFSWSSELETRANAKDEELHYNFSAGTSRATLSAEVPFSNLAALKSIAIAHQADASWNRIWFAIELDGRRFEAGEPYLLAGKVYAEASYQLPGPDDDNDMRIREWIKTRQKEGTGFYNQPGKARIEFSLENTSAWTKVADKFSYNYKKALGFIPFWRYLLTSLFLVGMNIVLAIFSSSLVAYSFARLQWPGRGICWAILLGTIMIPGQVTLIPSFLIMKWLGWYGTLRPLWIGSAFGGVFFVFMLRQFMKNIPKDLEDAARIDGCGYWQIYWHVILPLVKPTLAAIGIFTFMATWNDFMGPLMYLSDQKDYPLSLGLFAFKAVAGKNQENQGMMMAASLMMTVPVIALFFAAQKHFIEGVTFAGIKG